MASTSSQLSVQRARGIEAREEIEIYLASLLSHDCPGRLCRDCEALDSIAWFVRTGIFKMEIQRT